MVTSGPLLPLPGPGWRECRYWCAVCARNDRPTVQYVTFGPGDVPPAWLKLPCHGAALDAGTWLEHRPLHVYVLAELEAPPLPSDP